MVVLVLLSVLVDAYTARAYQLDRDISEPPSIKAFLDYIEKRASALENVEQEKPARPSISNAKVAHTAAEKLVNCAFSRSISHTITLLDVPLWVDPRRDAELRCQYIRQAQDPPLHSVKWYRDTAEIFRYTPQEYETRAFNNTGISVTNSSCDARSCVITVKPERGTAKYTCEVSSEGPRFAVDRRSSNMTLAVLPEYEPLITGLPTLVQAGEQALVNCTSDYSVPAATLDWFVDSEPQEDPLIVGVTHVSRADSEGLRASWRTLHVFPDDYETHRGYLSLRCRATLATRPPHVRSMAVRLYVAARPLISSYMFSKNNAIASNVSERVHSDVVLTLWTFLLIFTTQVPFTMK